MRLTAADYHDLTRVSSPAVSPDGSTVAYVSHRAIDDETTDASVSVVPTAGGDPRRFTTADGVDAEPTFSPDGAWLAFTSTRGDDDLTQLWMVPTDGGEARPVTDVPGGVTDVEWSPDGDRIAFVGETTAAERDAGTDCHAGDYDRETPDPRVVDRLVYRRGTEYLDGTRRHLYVADVCDVLAGDSSTAPPTDAVTRVTDGDVDHASPTWSDDDTLSYAVSRRRDGGDPDDAIEFEVVTHDLAAGETRHVAWSEAWDPALAATADGRVAYLRTPTDDGPPVQTDVEVVAPDADGPIVPTAGLDRTVLAERGFCWGPDEQALYAVTPDEGAFVVRRFSVDAGEVSADDTDDTDGSTDGHDVVVDAGEVDGLAVGPGVVAVTKSAADHPGDVFVVDSTGERRLTAVNATLLADRDLATPEEVWFESPAGPVQGWLMLPPDAADVAGNGDGNRDGGVDENGDGNEDEVGNGNEDEDGGADSDDPSSYPLIVEIHGGPHAMWTTAGTMWHEFRTLAARGYAVFWCNPRGSLGYGEAFAAANVRDWGAVTAQDVLAGVDAVCERDAVDDSQLFLTGGSFGGFMTAWLVGHDDRFRAAVAQRGVYDLASFYGSSDAFKLVEWDFETTPWADAGFLWEQSPASVAHEVTTPTLVLHAERDFRVPVNNGELLYLLLKKNGVDTRLVRYPREGHELSRSGEPGHVVDRLERIARWFDGYSVHHDAARALDRGDDGLSGTASDASTGRDSADGDD
jgi:dipeptidyl aminopeptidase/acylaminoacyl peptidase